MTDKAALIQLQLDRVHSLVHYLKEERGSHRLGVGSSRFVAECALGLVKRKPVIVPLGKEAAFLAPLSITMLDLEEKEKHRLMLLGVETIGLVAKLGIDPLVRLFGRRGELLFKLAHGVDERSFNPLREQEEISTTHRLDEPVGSVQAVEANLGVQLTSLFDTLSLEKKWCRELMLELELEQGEPVCLACRFSRCLAASDAMRHLLRRLSQTKLRSALIAWRLKVTATAPMQEGQLLLFVQKHLDHQKCQVESLCQEMRGHFSPKALTQVVWDEPLSRLPERRAHLESLLHRAMSFPLQEPLPIQLKEKEGRPSVVYLGTRWSYVSSQRDRWCVYEDWWTEAPVERQYHQIATESGKHLLVFYDRCRLGWFTH